MVEKFICIHGHFYQPPRENPWLEEVEFEESASPYHDWNTRVTAECYAPNSASRIMDPAMANHRLSKQLLENQLQLWSNSPVLVSKSRT